jgi:hypothetical protein
MSEPDIITAEEILRDHGREILDRMLAYGWHHTDDRGQPYWTYEEAERIFGLMAAEDEAEDREVMRGEC